jgi:hypothetical protein
MGRTDSGFRWDYDKIRPSLKSAPQKGRAYLSRITTYHAMRAQTYARIMARWRDRSGNARGGLTGVADNSGSGSWHYELILYHQMKYGIWLEIRWSGRYAIIKDTLRQEAPQYFKTAEQVLDKMFGSGQ